MNMRFTLNDSIVKESLKAVSDNAHARYAAKKVVLAGGMANQLYNSDRPQLLRPTTDIDFSVYPIFRNSDFRDFEPYVSGNLTGYKPSSRTSSRQYEIRVNDNGYPLFIHFDPKPSASYLERISKWLERTHENANEIESAEVGTKISVIRPEDFLVGKMRRLAYAETNGLVPEDLKGALKRVKNRDFDFLPQEKLAQFLEEVVHERDVLPSFVDANGEELRKRSMEYKVRKDLYDISLISSRLAGLGFDEQYYDSSLTMARNEFKK